MRHPKIEKVCVVCGKKFSTFVAWDKKVRGGKRCCSRECSSIEARIDYNDWEKFWAKLEIKDNGCWEWPGPYQTRHPDYPYGKVHLSWRTQESVAAHRLAWEIVHGPIPDGLIVRHSCDNPKCCNPQHLLIGTCKDNSQDMVTRNRQMKGNRHFRAKLREEYIADIRERLLAGESQQSIADDYGVCQVTISSVSLGETWRHVV